MAHGLLHFESAGTWTISAKALSNEGRDRRSKAGCTPCPFPFKTFVILLLLLKHMHTTNLMRSMPYYLHKNQSDMKYQIMTFLITIYD